MTTIKNKPSEKTADRSLVITRVFDAPRHLVFEAWTKKEHLIHWFAPQGFTVSYAEGDLRPGGEWSSCMVKPDGEKLIESGVYREIIKNELLVFTHAWEADDGKPEHETIITVRFADEGKKTKLSFEQAVFKTVDSRNRHNEGWTECFDSLSDYLNEIQK